MAYAWETRRDLVATVRAEYPREVEGYTDDEVYAAAVDRDPSLKKDVREESLGAKAGRVVDRVAGAFKPAGTVAMRGGKQSTGAPPAGREEKSGQDYGMGMDGAPLASGGAASLPAVAVEPEIPVAQSEKRAAPWQVQGVIDTAKEVGEGFRKFAVYGYGGLSAAEHGLLKPVADAWDFYAEKAGLKDEEKQSGFSKFVEGIGEIAGLTEEAAGPLAGAEPVAAAVASGLGALPVIVPTYGAVASKLGVHALAAMGALQAAPSGDPKAIAKAIASGYAMAGGLRASGALPAGLREATAGTTFAAITAAEGGDLESTIASGLLGVALTAVRPGPSLKDFAEGVRGDIQGTAKQIQDSNWYRKLTIRERGLVKQDMSARVAGLKAQGLNEAQILRTIKRVYGTDSPEFREMWQRVAVDTGRAGKAGEAAPAPVATEAAIPVERGGALPAVRERGVGRGPGAPTGQVFALGAGERPVAPPASPPPAAPAEPGPAAPQAVVFGRGLLVEQEEMPTKGLTPDAVGESVAIEEGGDSSDGESRGVRGGEVPVLVDGAAASGRERAAPPPAVAGEGGEGAVELPGGAEPASVPEGGRSGIEGRGRGDGERGGNERVLPSGGPGDGGGAVEPIGTDEGGGVPEATPAETGTEGLVEGEGGGGPVGPQPATAERGKEPKKRAAKGGAAPVKPAVVVPQSEDDAGGLPKERAPVAAELPPEAQNHRVAPEDEIVPVGQKGKVRGNLAAIRLLATLESERRLPSPEEKKILARYVGWGGTPQVFDEYKARYERDGSWGKQWGKLYDEVRTALDKNDWARGAASTINAHYTADNVIRPMWGGVRRLGFTGKGKVGEFGAGIGHFGGMEPDEMRAAGTAWTMVEKDSVSGRLLKMLYPQADVRQGGLEDTKIPGHSLDVVIGNFPFAKDGPKDKRYPGFSLHNYFFARALDAVRPGGLVAAITSSSTMDSPASREARRWMAERADLVGAIRLPNTAFKGNAGTEVTTDIVFLRKKDGTAFEGVPWGGVRELVNSKGQTLEVNEYFVKHPEMMLGEMRLEGTQYRGGEPALVAPSTQDLGAELARAIELLPEGVLGNRLSSIQSQREASLTRGDAEGETAEGKEGSIVFKGGSVYEVSNGTLQTPEWGTTAAKVARAKGFVSVRDALNSTIELMLSTESGDEEIRRAQLEMEKRYDALVKRHGPLNLSRGGSWTHLEDDPEFTAVLALERVYEVDVERKGRDGKPFTARETRYDKMPIFRERTIFPFVDPSHAETVDDAVGISMAYKGRLDLDYMGRLLGQDPVGVEKLLLDTGEAFRNPRTGIVEGKDEYLSGEVRTKLKEAQALAEEDPHYEANVKALEAVQPKRIPLELVEFRIGSAWVPPKVVEAFLGQVLGVSASVSHTSETATWNVSVQAGQDGSRNLRTYGTARMPGHKLVAAALNLKSVTISDELPDGKKEKNEKETLAAQAKQAEIQAEFKQWVRKMAAERPAFAKGMEDIYNDRYNATVRRVYRGPEWKWYPGMAQSEKMVPRPKQKAAVTRAVQESVLLAHAVGTGKTLIQATTAMEWRRLGMANKVMVVVQNATVGQFARGFKQMYPTAKILAPSERQRSAKMRGKLMTMIATGDWDAVIVPQSFFNMLGDSAERMREFVEAQVQELTEAKYRAAQEDGRKSPKVKDIQRAIDKHQTRLAEMLKRAQDDGLTFEQLGVDGLIVDEAHAYKKLEFQTGMDNIKGLDKGASKRALGLYLKARWIQEKRNGRNVVLATGTPISNTLAEAWSMIRLVRPDLLKTFGVENFDDFAATFGDTVTNVEQTPGGDFKSVTRFARYMNVPELKRFFHSGADVVLQKDAGIVGIPRHKGGQPETVIVERGPELANYVGVIREMLRRFAAMTGRAKRENSHIPLVAYGLGRKATLDLRLVDSSMPDEPTSKLNRCVDNVYRVWEETQDRRGVQLVFADLFRSSDHVFNLYDEIKRKLVAKGIPAKEIALANEAKSTDAQERLWAKANLGDVRVLIGGTEKMGVGVNVQEKAVAIHHMDPPWRPMDMEQRNGRVFRPGNENGEVYEFRYGVQNTLDSSVYQMLETKYRMTLQVLANEDVAVDRTLEEESEMGYAQQMAAYSGNPLAMEKVGLESKMRTLEATRASHFAKLSQARQDLTWAESALPEREAELVKIREGAARYGEVVRGEAWGTVDGKEYRVPKEFAEAADAVMTKAMEKGLKEGGISSAPSVAGKVNVAAFGLPMSAEVVLQHDVRTGLPLHANVHWEASGFGFGIGGDVKTGTGLVQSIRHGMQTWERLEQQTMDRIETYKRDIPELRGLISGQWPYQAELDEAARRAAEIDKELEAVAQSEAEGAEVPGEEDAPGMPAAGASKRAVPPTVAPPLPKGVTGQYDGRLPVAMDATTGARTGVPQIMAQLEKTMQAAAGSVPIRSGRYRGKMVGIYKPGPQVVRLNSIDNIPTAAHEVAHALQHLILGDVKSGVWKGRPMPMRKELIGLGKGLYGTRKPVAGYTAEGWSEFVRYWLTRDDVNQVAPRALEWFEGEFLVEHPDVAAQLHKAREMILVWRSQGAEARARAQMQDEPGRWKSLLSDLAEGVSYAAQVEGGAAIERASREAAHALGRPLRPGEDPFTLFSWKRAAAPVITRRMIENEMLDMAGNPVGPSLRDAVAPVKGRVSEFTTYLYGRRAVERWGKGMNPGIQREDAEFLVAKYGTPEFQIAAEAVYRWWDGVLDYVGEASPRMAAVVDRVKAGSRDYVPLARVIDTKKAKGLAARAQSNPLFKMHGSGLPVKNLWEQTMATAERLVSMAHHELVGAAIVKMAQIPGMGHVLEEIPQSVVLQKVSVAQLRDQLDALFGEIALNAPDEAILSYYVPAAEPKGSEPIISWQGDDGRVRWFQVAPELYEAMTGLTAFDMKSVKGFGPAMELLLAAPSRIFRLGTTGVRPTFSLVTNPTRDVQTFIMQTQSHENPAALAADYVAGMAEAVAEVTTGKEGPHVRAFLNLGASMGQPLMGDVSHRKRAARGLFKGRIMRTVSSPLDALRELLSAPESGPRVAELRAMAKEVGWTPGTRMTMDQAARLAVAAKRVTVDFSASGSVGRVLNQAIPFYNPGIQGARAFGRTFKNHPLRTLLWGLASLTVPALWMWWANKDKEWYQAMPWRERYLYNNIDDGVHVWQIPRAFEWGNLFQVVPEAILDSFYRQDSEAAVAALGHVFETTNPVDYPVLLRAAKEQWENRIAFWDRPIVPRGEVDLIPGQQYGPYTSRLAKMIGSAFPRVSPRRVDSAVRAVAGGVGADVLELIGDRPKGKQDDGFSSVPVVGRLMRSGRHYTATDKRVADFWDLYQEQQAIARTASKRGVELSHQEKAALSLARKAAADIRFAQRMAIDLDAAGRDTLYKEVGRLAEVERKRLESMTQSLRRTR